MLQKRLTIETSGRRLIDITPDVNQTIQATGIENGLCHLFIHHTSASLIITENTDPKVKVDLNTFMQALAPDDAHRYQHQDEGLDDMPAHIRSMLTATSLSIPIQHGELALGRWQSVYVWEHRLQGKARDVTITIDGLNISQVK